MLYLLHPETDHLLDVFLEKYMNTRLDSDYILNYIGFKLVPKEKEMKDLGKIYGCQTHQGCYKNVVQETNDMAYLGSYCR